MDFFWNIKEIIKIKRKEIEGPDHRQNLDIYLNFIIQELGDDHRENMTQKKQKVRKMNKFFSIFYVFWFFCICWLQSLLQPIF